MGDRANIVLNYGTDDEGRDQEIYLYTHWAGHRWPEELRKALIFGKGRWGDSAYLGRIIASKVFEDCHDGLTGGGIAPYITDNEYPLIYVYLEEDLVRIGKQEWSFEDYTQFPLAWKGDEITAKVET